ncbi:MAG: winged helix-turn-helix transcriptional regulator [Deltaproteobacteria bacterium]|jgi:DNA-binding MarR family transcriptional regulator|nr:winged helix-turn-helix transcriptional regulator [Deltaproteobacteria bacterium]
MKSRSKTKLEPDAQIVLDSIRKIVRTLRQTSKFTEKNLGLSTAQIFVLQKLAASKVPLSINKLAAATLTHQSSVSVVVSKLVYRKLIDRVESETDSRSVELSISKHGQSLLTKSPMSIQERLMNGLAQLSETQRTALVKGLQALVQKSGMENEEPSMLLEDDTEKK